MPFVRSLAFSSFFISYLVPSDQETGNLEVFLCLDLLPSVGPAMFARVARQRDVGLSSGLQFKIPTLKMATRWPKDQYI